jgi:putative nucleotidyltransferase with HDIG domain
MDPREVGTEAAGESLPVVLIVDDDPGILKAVERTLRKLPIDVVAANGPDQAIEVLSQGSVSVMVSDYMMPGMNGLELLTLMRQKWPRTVGIMMTACEDIRVAAEAVNRRLVHAFLTKPWETKALREAVSDAVALHHRQSSGADDLLARNLSLSREIDAQASAAAFSLARAVDARDPYTHRHSEKVSAFALALGRSLKLDDEQMEELRIGGLLHDLGKIGVSDGILLKPGRLTAEEYQAIQRHPKIGASIIEPIHFSANIRLIIRQHHENHDGSGYPDGLSGDRIHLLARIVHVVDAYEAMSANRVYRTARSADWIVEEFTRCRGQQFDPQLTDVFLEELAVGRIAESVRDLLD